MKEKYHISIIIIMISLALFGCYHIYYSTIDQKNDTLISQYIEDNEKSIVKPLVNEKEEYLGVIEIPKINLKEGFYSINSDKNNVNKNVTILPESIFPDNNNSIIYLAAHSGSGPLAYFKNIYQLVVGDMIKLNYLGKEYQYTITKVYETRKIGRITINRNLNENYLILTTCSNNKDMQIVIISKMVNKV